MTRSGNRTIRPELRPRRLLAAYASGAFPMPGGQDEAQILWFSPDPRGLLPLDERFHVPRRLRRTIRQGRLRCTLDRAFGAVMRLCAARPEGTWISADFLAAYARLHELGLAHSLEVWPVEPPPGGEAGQEPVAGLYGVALGAAFFAESMFHRRRDAGNVALISLVEHLRRQGFLLCDVQWMTAHLRRFGGCELPRAEYLALLAEALARRAEFLPGR